ncbi:MAG TPA: dCMP deaminase [Actinopolymorphaceae bacterium]
MLDDRTWLERAIDLSGRCPPVDHAYSVGALVVDASGGIVCTGYSRETDDAVHAEEAALDKVERWDPRLRSATLYTSLEPCSSRRSRPRTCTELVLAAGIPRVVMAWREPDLFVADCQGFELLTAGGVEVVELSELAPAARAVNSHLEPRAPHPRAGE